MLTSKGFCYAWIFGPANMIAMMGRCKVPGVFFILLVGALGAIALARALPQHVDASIRIMVVLSLAAAFFYWADLPANKS